MIPQLEAWDNFYVIVGSSAAALTGLEDWLWHTVFPLASYTAIVIASALLSRNLERSLFAVAAAVLSLVLIGIHNAWDTVTYLAMGERNRQNAS